MDAGAFKYLSLRQLKLVAKLGTELNLSRTAHVLHITQPAASRSLAQLESILGISLFHREGGKLVPTAAGMRFIHHAQRVLDQLNTAEQEIAGASVLDELRVGAIASISSTLLANAAQACTREFPGTRIKLFTGNIGYLYGQLLSGGIDLMVSHAELSVDLNRVEVSPIYEEFTSIVSGASHQLARRKSLSWGDIANQPWLLPPPFTPSRSKLDRILALYRTVPAVDFSDLEVESAAVALELISSGPYLWSLSHREARYWERAGRLKLLAQPETVLQGHMCSLRLRGSELRRDLAAFVESLRRLA